MKIEKVPLGQLTPDPDNAKEHTPKQIAQIKASIERFGNNDPIAVWGKDNLIVEGHGRYEALKALGYKEAEIIRLDRLTDEERRAYALAHNQLTMNTGWLDGILEKNLAAIESIDMADFGFDVADYETPAEIVEDEAPEIDEQKEPTAKRGDIWNLGDHRLMCGDATNADDVALLMVGATADISITSPPYGVANSAKLRDHYERGKETRKTFYNEHSDNADEWGSLLRASFDNMKTASLAQFVNVQMLSENKKTLVHFLSDNAEHLVDVIVWDKKRSAPQMHDNVLNNRFEFIFVFSNTNGSRAIPFADFHGNVCNMIELTTGNNEYADVHRAVFPVELPAEIMKIASKAKSVLDIFGGTGTTMMACEQTGRKCYMMELDPKYCDVIIQRWENFTGKKAELLND